MNGELVELEGFEPQEAEHLVSKRVCARCWGDLKVLEFENERMVQVICPVCGESVEVTGHISQNTPGIILENAKYTYREVSYNLRDLFPKKPGRKETEAQILQSLGF